MKPSDRIWLGVWILVMNPLTLPFVLLFLPIAAAGAAVWVIVKLIAAKRRPRRVIPSQPVGPSLRPPGNHRW